MADSPWPRYLLACVLLARRRQLPLRPARFLDWAYHAGLMRLAGTAPASTQVSPNPLEISRDYPEAYLAAQRPPDAPELKIDHSVSR